MKYKGKYAEMAEQFKSDGCDNATVERFIRQEIEADEFRAGEGKPDFDALRQWMKLPDRDREILLRNSICTNCGMTSFKSGYFVRKDSYGLILEGRCAKCGSRIARAID